MIHIVSVAVMYPLRLWSRYLEFLMQIWQFSSIHFAVGYGLTWYTDWLSHTIIAQNVMNMPFSIQQHACKTLNSISGHPKHVHCSLFRNTSANYQLNIKCWKNIYKMTDIIRLWLCPNASIRSLAVHICPVVANLMQVPTRRGILGLSGLDARFIHVFYCQT